MWKHQDGPGCLNSAQGVARRPQGAGEVQKTRQRAVEQLRCLKVASNKYLLSKFSLILLKCHRITPSPNVTIEIPDEKRVSDNSLGTTDSDVEKYDFELQDE